MAGALLALGLIAPDGLALAHGGATRIGEGRAGPYEVVVLASRSPRTGSTDISVAVSLSGGEAAPGVAVSIEAAPSGASSAGTGGGTRHRAAPEAGTPGTYHAIVAFPTSGRWELRIQVAGSAGSGEVLLPASVSPSVWGVTPTELFAASLPLAIVIALVTLRRFGGAPQSPGAGTVAAGGDGR